MLFCFTLDISNRLLPIQFILHYSTHISLNLMPINPIPLHYDTILISLLAIPVLKVIFKITFIGIAFSIGLLPVPTFLFISELALVYCSFFSF